jgi:5-methyltetrahydropteroyltriglutamate--homocysteine methyltransferase
MVGVIDLSTNAAESAEQVAERIRAALKHIAAEKLVVAPDCGMKYLARDVAYAKLAALARGAAMVRKEIAG